MTSFTYLGVGSIEGWPMFPLEKPSNLRPNFRVSADQVKVTRVGAGQPTSSGQHSDAAAYPVVGNFKHSQTAADGGRHR